jgi:hypothetical protein
MSYTKELLQQAYSISIEDIDATLMACGLPIDQGEYSDEEIKSHFDFIRQSIQQGKTFKQAAAQFKRETKKRTTDAEFPPMNILEMLTHICSEYGIQLELTESVEIMSACGLSPNQKEYRQLECERFLEACSLIKEQGQTHQQVAAHFGINKTCSNGHNNAQYLTDQITNVAVTSESGLVSLVSQVTEKRAEQIPGLVNQIYLKNVVSKLAESSDEIKNFYAGLEERILEQIEGKSPIKAIMEGQWQMTPLPSSSEKLMLLPDASENDTNTD